MKTFTFAVTALLFAQATVAEVKEVKLIPLSPDFEKKIQATTTWERCGLYFAASDTPGGRMLLFSYADYLGEERWSVAHVSIALSKLKLEVSTGVLWPFVAANYAEQSTTLHVNPVDYLAATRCLNTKKA